MEFKLTKPIEQLRSSDIGFNREQLKTQLSNALAKYEGITYDDKSIAVAKKDRAGLNNLKAQIDTVRKTAKAEWSEPYLRFEAEVKELIALVDKPIQAIDAQVKDYEARQKEAKRTSLNAFFDAIIGDNAALLKFDDIFNDRWLNVTVTEAKATEEIRAIVEQFDNDLSIIGNEGGEFKAQLYDYFLRTRNLAATFAEKQRLIAQKSAMEALNARLREMPHADIQAPSTAQIQAERHVGCPQTLTIRFEVEGTRDELMALSEYLKSNKLNYRRII